MRSFLLAPAFALAAVGSLARADDQARRPVFYQDPDGKPFYASGPKKTSDGRDYKPVFDDAAPQPATPVAAATPAPAKPPGDHRILYYRNPMGLPCPAR